MGQKAPPHIINKVGKGKTPVGVAIILFSDNVGNNKLHNIEFTDFCKEYPTVNVLKKNTGGENEYISTC